MMTKYILIANPETLLTQRQVEDAHPNVSSLFASGVPEGYAEVLATEPPSYNPVTYSRAEVAPTQDGEGNWVQTWQVSALAPERVTINVEARKLELLEAAEEKRVAVMQLGRLYQFPDGAGTIQVRNATDTGNINGIVTTALILQSMGVTDAFTDFNDHENVEHPLTPDQAIAMGMDAGAYVSRQYKVKWAKENEIKAMTTPEQLAAFDLDSGWGL